MNAQIQKLRAAAAACLMVAVGVAGAAVAAGTDTGPSQADRDFIAKAAQGGLMEVAAGKLAAARAQDPAVKAFGQKMLADHTQANQVLSSLAASKQMTLPDAVGADDQEALGKLEGLNGTEFDQTYVRMMIKDHVTDIEEFQKEAKSGDDPGVKAFAEQTLPTLRHHLQMANGLSKQQK